MSSINTMPNPDGLEDSKWNDSEQARQQADRRKPFSVSFHISIDISSRTIFSSLGIYSVS